MIRLIVISVGGSSSRRRISPITYPTASPSATPPTVASRNSRLASSSENVPPTAAATRDPVGDQGRGVVDQALALDQVDDAAGSAQAAHDGRRRHRVGR